MSSNGSATTFSRPEPACLLDVQGLHVSYGAGPAAVQVVRGVSFTLAKNKPEKLAIVGESGSGKTTVGRALLRLLPHQAVVSAQRMVFDGIDLLTASGVAMGQLRGRRLSMILQDPKFSLNPVMRVGQQIAEAVQRGQPTSNKATRQQAVVSLLARVRIHEPRRVAMQYPHELSGGMGQRVMIAMMLAQSPQLLVADEPTSALDVSVRQEVLSLLDELVAEQGLALIFISHDLNLVRRFCDRVLVMYQGRVVESLLAADLSRAEHPYTQALLQAVPSLHQHRAVLPVMQRDAAWSHL